MAAIAEFEEKRTVPIRVYYQFAGDRKKDRDKSSSWSVLLDGGAKGNCLLENIYRDSGAAMSKIEERESEDDCGCRLRLPVMHELSECVNYIVSFCIMLSENVQEESRK